MQAASRQGCQTYLEGLLGCSLSVSGASPRSLMLAAPLPLLIELHA